MNIHLLEMPLDFGASRHGSDMGPSAIRLAGIKERLESLGHTISNHSDIFSVSPQEYEQVGNPKAKYLKPITKACTKLAERVEKICADGEFPFILGGDHSIALGSIAGAAAFAKKSNKKLGVRLLLQETFTENVLQHVQDLVLKNSQIFIMKAARLIQKIFVL